MAKQTVAEKRDGEKLLVSEMIALYCRKNHHTAKSSLCPQGQALHDYALQRIERCPFMETKTFCSACKVHCYKPEMREQIRTVMRWSGPRMLFVHPVLAVRHMKELQRIYNFLLFHAIILPVLDVYGLYFTHLYHFCD